MISLKSLDKIWKRLRASDLEELIDYGRSLEIDLLPSNSTTLNRPNRVLAVALRQGEMVVSEMIWNMSPNGQVLYTVETGHTFLLPGRLEFALRGFEHPTALTVALLLVQQLIGDIVTVQDHLDRVLDDVAVETRLFQRLTGTTESPGIENLREVDDELKRTELPQSYVIRSLFDLDRVARRLRELAEEESQEIRLADDVIAEIEAGIDRSQRIVKRNRFQWDSACSSINANNLNLNKIFNALWAIVIPSNVLINWYGQNFRVMPELSWWGTMPIQLIGCMLITLVPLWLVKQAGAMR